MTEPRPRTESELIEFLRSSDVRAPEELHRKVQSLIAERSASAGRSGSERSFARPRSRFGLGFAATAIAAVVAVAVAVGLSGGGNHELGLREASALTLSSATAPAPTESVSNRGQLSASVDGVSFPYWGDRFGWRATGTRHDRIGGRTVTTVFYQDGRGRRLGYAIVAGTPAPRLSGGVVSRRGGVPYRLTTEHGVQVITWLRNGHLCVVAGHGVESATLLRLASWGAPGSIAS
jgi:hypothetical protein